jgi:hypothetical protein
VGEGEGCEKIDAAMLPTVRLTPMRWLTFLGM